MGIVPRSQERKERIIAWLVSSALGTGRIPPHNRLSSTTESTIHSPMAKLESKSTGCPLDIVHGHAHAEVYPRATRRILAISVDSLRYLLG